MGYPQYPIITDELLSAYIDNAVNDVERVAVETAIANDPDIAWRVESLRSTVSILGQLADVPLPRSFTLNEGLLEMASAGETPRQAIHPHSSGTIWDHWLDFWRSGSPLWRNAAAISVLVLVVFLVGDFIGRNQMSVAQNGMTTVARTNVPASESTGAVAGSIDENVVAPAVVAIAPEPIAELEDQAAPEPMATTAAVGAGDVDPESEAESEAESEVVQPVSVALNSEHEAAGGMALAEERVLSDAPSDDNADEALLPAEAASEESAEVESPPVALSAARVNADSLTVESTPGLDAIAESDDEIDEPVADLLFAASAIGEGDSTAIEDSENSAPPVEAGESAAPESTDTESAIADPAADAVNGGEADAQPQPLMLTDTSIVATEVVETDMAEGAMADENAAEADSLEEEIASSKSAVIMSAEMEPPPAAVNEAEADEAGNDGAEVGEVAAKELAVQEAPQTEPQMEGVQPSVAAMAGTAQRSAPANPSRQASEQGVEPSALPMENNASNSTRLFGIVQILLAILALIFFILWLHSRSQPTAFSSQD